LQGKEIALKKAAAAKGSKAEQKAKKKIAEEEVLKLDAKLRARHAKELASLGFQSEDTKDVKGIETLVKAIAGVSTTAASQQARLSKGQKWRDRRVQQAAEREQRIKEEQESVVSDRVLEDQELERKLHPLGFSLKEMKPDGHCLYRAVADQLSLYPNFCPQHSYQQLRSLAAAYMCSHADVFLPFVAAESTWDSPAGKDLQSKFEVYCR
jgi:OTU domain-containing protein 6